MSSPESTTDATPVTPDATAEPTVASKRKAQLALARETGRQKKRARDEEFASMKSQLASLAAKKETPAEVETPVEQPPKRIKVTKEVEEEYEEVPFSWQPMMAAVGIGGLAAGSWYMQNVIGPSRLSKKAPAKQEGQAVPPTAPQAFSPPVPIFQVAPASRPVGQSGFTM